MVVGRLRPFRKVAMAMSSTPASRSRFPRRLGIVLAALVVAFAGVWCATLPQRPSAVPSTALADPTATPLGRWAAAGEKAHPGDSGLRLLQDSLDDMVARAALSRAAEKTLDLQTYLFHDDDIGGLVADLLLEAADRGVRVRLLVDDMDMGGRDAATARLDAHPNIEIRLFNPFRRRGLLRPLDFLFAPGRVTRRMHSKSFIADNAAAIVGGRNIGDEYFSVPGESIFLDADLLAVGPVVRDVSAAFDAFWNSPFAVPMADLHRARSDPAELDRLRRTLRAHTAQMGQTRWADAVRAAPLSVQLSRGEVPLEWAPATLYYDPPEKLAEPLDDPSTHMAPHLEPLVTDARSELVVVSPYFVPRKEGAALLESAARRGVRVRVLTNSLAANDVWAVHGGYAPYREGLLRAGVELFELKVDAFAERRRAAGPGVEETAMRLHAKTFVRDQRWVFVGSFNFDPRSVEHNTEIGLVVDSPVIAAQVSRAFDVVTAPENAYRVVLAGERLRWEAVRDGRFEVLAREPDAGFWRRTGAWLARVLPVEGQL